MADHATQLAVLAEPGLLFTLIPVGLVVLLLVSFEVAVAITISTLPRSRFQQRWTAQEQRRVLRVFVLVFAAWPVIAGLIVAHVYLSTLAALIADAGAVFLFLLGIRWLWRGMKHRRLVLTGHCANCLYDLRASRNRDHCPECGVELGDHPAKIASR